MARTRQEPSLNPQPPNAVKRARLLLGLDLAAVVESAQVPMRTLNRLEAGEAMPSLPVARRLARLYQTSIDVLWPEGQDGQELEAA